MSAPDVVVVGGGVIGLATAWQAAKRGLSAAVVDAAHPGKASWAAAGMLAPVTEVHYGEEPLLALNLESSRIYPEFVRELQDAAGMDVGYRACGTVLVARDADDNAAFAHLYSFQSQLGLAVKRLRAADCRAIEPALAPGVRGGSSWRGSPDRQPGAFGRARARLQVGGSRSSYGQSNDPAERPLGARRWDRDRRWPPDLRRGSPGGWLLVGTDRRGRS